MENPPRNLDVDTLVLSDEEGLDDPYASANEDSDPISEFCQRIRDCAKQIQLKVAENKSVTKSNKESIIEFSKKIVTITEGFESYNKKRPQRSQVEINKDNIVSIIKDTITVQLSKINKPTNTVPAPAYATVTKQAHKPKEQIPTTKPALIISSKDEVHSSAETLQKWKKSISFKDTNFSPASVKYVSNFKLRVEFDTESQRDETLRKVDGCASDIKAEVSKKLKPMFILKGISNDTPPETLPNIIYNQNDFIKNITEDSTQMTFRFTKYNKNPNLYNAVFMTSPELFRAIIKNDKLNVDHQRVQVEEYIPLLQCYNCLQFGHTRKRCTLDHSTCSHCSAGTHTYRDCPVKKDLTKSACYNCITHNKKYNINKSPPNHSATSNYCPRITQMLAKIRSRIDYGYKP